jgi:putative holliday junction resolvase
MDKTHQVLLGFDFGMRRIGVAVGQTITQSAQPLPVIYAKDGIPEWKQIADLIKTWQVDGLVVGMPLTMNNEEQLLSFASRKFANRLKEKYKLPVYFVDERFTTKEAKATFGQQKSSGIEIDSYAAKLILESWLRDHTE